MTTQEFKRKLAAILSADVEGYSCLMREDEEWTIHTLNTHKDVMRGLIQQHRGRVVDAPGDNVLAEFVSVVDAVNGAYPCNGAGRKPQYSTIIVRCPKKEGTR